MCNQYTVEIAIMNNSSLHLLSVHFVSSTDSKNFICYSHLTLRVTVEVFLLQVSKYSHGEINASSRMIC